MSIYLLAPSKRKDAKEGREFGTNGISFCAWKEIYIYNHACRLSGQAERITIAVCPQNSLIRRKIVK